MLAKTIRHLLPFIAVVYFGTCTLRADEVAVPLADPANALKALQSKIDSLRKEGKKDEADKLEIERSKAVLRVAGVKPEVMPDVHADLPDDPFISPPTVELPKVIQPGINPATISKEQRVGNLMAAAARLKAAGLVEDAGRYEAMASKLAQEGSSGDIEALRREVAELRGQVEHLRKVVDDLAKPKLVPTVNYSMPATTYPLPGPAPMGYSPRELNTE